MAARVRVEVGDSPRGAPGRGTTQRSAVLATLESSGRFRTAQEIYSELRQSGARVGLTTVYRHLQKLADSGVIHAVQTASRQTAYRQCATASPHHHLICVGCGAGVEITGSEMDDWVESLAVRLGYTDVSHSLEIRGLCPTCADSSPSHAVSGSNRTRSSVAQLDWDSKKGER
jgi:Fur family transcriptional regulator, ferric uptake regulator